MTTGDDTQQLKAWRGEFGTAYIDRNEATAEALRARLLMWGRILPVMAGAPPRSILEVGANIGNNLRALAQLTPATLHAVEPNDAARRRLVADGVLAQSQIHDGSTLKLPFADGAVDLAFTCGVLIHVHPDDLAASCREICRVARRYVLCAEYFAQEAEEIRYRGHDGLLFRRDFGAFYADRHEELELVDYGFFWMRTTGIGNLTWWLFRKPA